MERKLVRKSNYLIEASYKLSSVEQKIILILASMIKPEDREFKNYSLRIQNIAQLMDLQTKDAYGYLKETTRNLLGKVFTITTPESELQTHWFSSAEYFEGRGEVEFTFDPKLKPFLLQLKERFTTYRLKEAIQLKSSFSIRMLELLRQYEKLGERVIEIQKLRDLLGIPDDQYKLYGDFKKRVILAAQKELGSKINFFFDFEEVKNGHAVEKLRFRIRSEKSEGQPTQNLPALSLDVDPDLQRLLAMLPEPYRDKESVKRLLKIHLKASDYDFVARNIVYANEKSDAVKPGPGPTKSGNYRNYLAKALRGDFGLPFQEDMEILKADEKKARLARETAAASTRKEQERILRDQENMERARVFRQSLTPEALETLREEALAKMPPPQREAVLQKATGAEILLKRAMDKICLERMKLT